MEIVEQIGAYAGFAAVVGLAVLSALYFSQARDVKRLREWAGRAPERAAEQEARIQAAAQQQQPAAAAQAGARPVAAPAPSPGNGPPVPGKAPPAGAPAAPGQAPVPAASPAQTGTTTAPKPAAPKPATGPPPPKPTPLPPLPSRTAASGGQTSILPPPARPKERWYRRINWPEPRYLALIVAGILIVGGGAAYGVVQLLEEDEAATPASVDNGAGDEAADNGERQTPARVNPADVTVAVLNGTTVTGLATEIASKLEGEGFQRGNVTNFTEQARNESVVMYSSGHQREARAVANRLKIGQIERVDAETQVLAGNATVTVVVGADQTQ
jgi:LytR cell envelope-related transcriptional attenuator